MLERPLSDWQQLAAVCGADLERAAASVGRLDQAVARSWLGDAWARRSAYPATIACLAADGYLFEIERLFALAGGLPVNRVKDFGTDNRAITALRRIQRSVGGPSSEGGAMEAESLDIEDALAGFHAVVGAPALLGAVMAFRSWLEAGQAASAAMTALPSFLAVRGLTGSPVPWLAGGLRRAAGAVGSYPAKAWTSRALQELGEAAAAGIRELEALTGLWRSWHAKVGPRRRNSRLPEVIDLLVAHPVQSPRQVSRVLGVSLRGASKLLDELKELRIVVAPLSRRSWRVLIAADLASLQDQVHHLPRSAGETVFPEPARLSPPVASAGQTSPLSAAQISSLRSVISESDDVIRRVTLRLSEMRRRRPELDNT